MKTEKMTETTKQITDIKAFASAVKQRLEQTHTSASVEIHEAVKNNSLNLTGITVREEGRSIAPVVYLEGFFEEYQNGKPLDEICQKIEEVSRNATLDTDFDVNGIKDFSKVRDKICYKLVNAEKNANLLDVIPHRLWQDLAVIYYIPISMESASGFPSITVKNSMLELWGVDEETLYRHAHVNTPALFHAEIMPLTDVIRNMLQGTEEPENTPLSLYVATNDCKINGAAVLLYDSILKEFAGQAGGDFYILPSSIHETLFLPVPSDSDGHALTEMVREINSGGCVAPDEILSDNVYLYHAEDGSVTLVS